MTSDDPLFEQLLREVVREFIAEYQTRTKQSSELKLPFTSSQVNRANISQDHSC